MADRRIRRLIEIVFDRSSARKVETQMTSTLERAGRTGGDNFLRELRSAFGTRMADLRVQLSKGLIDQDEFRRQSDAAAKSFNEGLIANIERARKEGKLTDQEYTKLARSLKRVGDEGRRSTQDVGRGMERIRTLALSVAGVVGGIFAVRRLKDWTVQMFNLGSEVAAVEAQFQTVFGTLTTGIERSMEGWRRIAGITTTELRRLLAGIGSMARGFGFSAEQAGAFSAEVVRLAGDLASFSGGVYTTEEAAKLLQSAIIGNTEAARSLMVNFTALDVTNRALAQTGKSSAKELTQQERALAALSVITERAGPQIGDLARQQTEADNRARILAARFRTMREELALALLPTFEKLFDALDRSNAIEKVAAAAKALADNMDEVVASVGALIRALVVGGGILAVTRLGSAIRAATGAVNAWRGAMAGARVLMGPTGWFILGVAALTELFRRQGRAAREAARATAEAMEEYKASLIGMDKAALESEARTVGARIRQIDESIAAEQRLIAEKTAEIERMESGHARNILRGDVQLAEARIRQAQEARAGIVGQYRAVLEELQALNAPAPATAGGDGDGDGDGDATADMRRRVQLLTQGHELEVLTRAERAAALQLAIDTRAELQRANLTLAERVELTERLRALEEVTGERSYAPRMAQQGPGGGPMVLTPVQTEQMRYQVSEWQLMLSQLGDHSNTVAMYMERSFSDFFTAMATGFDTTRDGFHSLTDAAVGIGASIVAGLAGGMRDYHLAQSVGKLAEGTWPPNPAAIAAAAQHAAAAGLFGALEGITSGAGRRRAVTPASAPGNVGASAADQAQRNSPPAIIYIDPFNPTNPVHARQVGQAVKLDVRLGGQQGARR